MNHQIINQEVVDVLLELEHEYRIKRVVVAEKPDEYAQYTHIIQCLQTAAWVGGASTRILEGPLKKREEIKAVLVQIMKQLQREVKFETQHDVARKMSLIMDFLPAFTV